MKKLIILNFILVYSLASANITKAQVFPLVLADSVTLFSPYQDMIVKGQLLKVRAKLNRHFGTTCQFEIEITNRSNKPIRATVGFVSSSSNNIYEVNSASINLKPDYYAVYKLELRECLKKGKKNAIVSCMSCNPRLGFL